MMYYITVLLTAISALGRIGIIGALDEELDLIKASMSTVEVDTTAQRIFTSGEINGQPCVCVRAGVGKVNAALIASILIREFDCVTLIYCGVAGGIDPGLAIGDIVISKRVLYHDFGQITPQGFTPFDTIGFRPDSVLVSIALLAARQIPFEPVPTEISGDTIERLPRILAGTVATGDQFIASEASRKWLEKTTGAECVEMEGAAVAQVCAAYRTPFVIIRCLSDIANENADLDFDLFLPYAAKNSSAIVLEMIRILTQ